MSETLKGLISIQEHMTLPFKHRIAHPIDMADLRLAEARYVLEDRRTTIGDRMDRLSAAARRIDPKGLTPTPKSIRIWALYDRAQECFWSVDDRLKLVNTALNLISEQVTKSYEHRSKVIQARKSRAGKPQ